MTTGEGQRSDRASRRLKILIEAPLPRALLSAVAGLLGAASPFLPGIKGSPAVLVVVSSPFLIWLSIYSVATRLLPTWTTGKRVALSVAIYFLAGVLSLAAIIAARQSPDIQPEIVLILFLTAWPIILMAFFSAIL